MDDGDVVDDLGICIETPSSKIAELQSNYRDPARRKEAYLDYYVHNHPLASWTVVVKALRWYELYHSYELHQQADVVENTYVQGMHLQSNLSHDIH